MPDFNLENPNLREKIYEGENALPRRILVEDGSYSFDSYIENEWISDFPTYSHRMRFNFVKGVGIVDDFLSKITKKYNEFINSKRNELNDFKLNLENEFSILRNRGSATNTVNGLISYNKVKELSTEKINELVPTASATVEGKISENRIKGIIDSKVTKATISEIWKGVANG